MAGNLASARTQKPAAESLPRSTSKSAVEDERSTFVRRHLGFVWRTLRRLGLSEADAADATQRVFLVATARLARIEPGRERAFLYGTATRIVSNVRRTSARRPLGDGDDVDGHVAEQPSAEELVDQRRARLMLDEILDGMTEELRTVFVLYEIEEMTMAEIAELIAVPPGTVASRLRRGRDYFQASVSRRSRSSKETP